MTFGQYLAKNIEQIYEEYQSLNEESFKKFRKRAARNLGKQLDKIEGLTGKNMKIRKRFKPKKKKGGIKINPTLRKVVKKRSEHRKAFDAIQNPHSRKRARQEFDKNFSRSFKKEMKGYSILKTKRNIKNKAPIIAGVGVAAAGVAWGAKRYAASKKYPKMSERLRQQIEAAKKSKNYRQFYNLKIKLAKLSALYGSGSKKLEKAKIKRYRELLKKSVQKGKLVMS